MDEIMDTKVVQMKFDNSQFRKGVEETIRQLDALDNSLQLQGASNGLNQVVLASKKTTSAMDSLASATGEVQRNFSALEVVGITVMMRLTNAAITYGKKIADNLWGNTLGQIISGGKVRSQNIENAKFQLEGLGVAWKDIGEDINYGVKDTAYGLDEAAKAAAQMVASMDLANGYTDAQSEQMRIALRAISGVAAMTNSAYSDIADVFTTVSSNGKLMTMQLRQLAARGLNASAVLAKYFTKTEEEINQMVTAGKIGFSDFAKAMDEAFGAHAKEANKTFQGSLSNVKAALSRIGAKFADPVYETLRKIFNGLIPAINNINKALDPVVKSFESIMNMVGRWASEFLEVEDTSRFLMQIIINLYSYLRPIMIAFLEVFGQYIPLIDKNSKSMGDFAKQFVLVGENADKLRDIFRSVFGVIDLVIHTAGSALKLLKTVGKGLLGIFSGLLGKINPTYDSLWEICIALQKILAVITDIAQTKIERAFEKLANVLRSLNWAKVLEVVQKVILVIAIAWELIVKLITLAIDGFIKIIPLIQNAASTLITFVSTLAYALVMIGTIIGGIFGKGKDFIANIVLKTRGLGQSSEISAAADSMESFSEESMQATSAMEETSEAIEEVTDRVDVLHKSAGAVTKEFRALNDEAENLKNAASDSSKENGKTHLPIGVDLAKANNIRPKSWLDDIGPSNGREGFSFFTTLASYFIGDEYEAVNIVTEAVDSFIDNILQYVKFAFSDIGPRLADEFHKFDFKFLGVSLNWLAIAFAEAVKLYAGFKIFKLVYDFLDFIPAIGRAISRASTALVIHEVATLLKSLSFTFLGISAFIGALTLMMRDEKFDLQTLKDILEEISKFIIDCVQKLAFYMLMFQGLVTVVKAISSLPDIFRFLTGAPMRESWVTKLVSLMKSFAILILAISGSIYLLSNIDADKDSWIRAIAIVGGTMVLMGILAGVLTAFGYKAQSASYSLKLTREGITKTGTTWNNSIQGIMFALAGIIAIITGAIALIAYNYDKRDEIEYGAKMVANILVVILGFVGILMLLTRLLAPPLYSVGVAEVVMKNMVKIVRSLGGVIISFGLAMIALAGALYIVNQVNIDDYNQSAFTAFFIIAGIFAALSLAIVALARYSTDEFNKKLIATASAMIGVSVSLSILLASIAGVFYVLRDMEIDEIQALNISALVMVFGLITMLMAYFLGKAESIKGFVGALLAFVGLAGAITAFGFAIKMIGESMSAVRIDKAVNGLTMILVIFELLLAAFAGISAAGFDIQLRGFIGILLAFVGLSGAILAFGFALKMIGETMTAEEIDKAAGWLVGITGLAILLVGVFGVLATLPAASGPIMGVLGILAVVFFALGGLFLAIGKATIWMSEGIERLEKVVEDFVKIDWKKASKSASSLGTFVGKLNFAAMTLKFSTIAGLLGIGVVAWTASKAIDALSDVDAESATKAAEAFGAFVSTLVVYEKDVEGLVKMAGEFTVIAGLVAVGMGLIVIATTELTFAALEFGVFVALMKLYGSEIEGALNVFLNAFIKTSELVTSNVETLSTGLLELIIIASEIVVAGTLLNVGAILFLSASAFMLLASRNLEENFNSFVNAFIAIGDTVKEKIDVLKAAASALIEFGLLSVIAGGFVALTAFEFFAAAALIGLGFFAFAFSLSEGMVYLNSFLEELNTFADNFQETVDRLSGPAMEFAALMDPLVQLGLMIDQGIAMGEGEGEDALLDAFRALIEAIINVMNETAEVESPSKRTAETGKFLDEGLAVGMKNNADSPKNAAKDVVTATVNEFSKGIPSATESGKNVVKAYGIGMKYARSGGGDDSGSYTGRDFVRDQSDEIQNETDAVSGDIANSGAQTTTSWAEGAQEGSSSASSTVTSFLSKIADLFGIDLSGLGSGSVTTWFEGILESLGINVEGIKGKVTGFGEIIGSCLGNGAGNAIDAAMHAIAKMLSTQLTDLQQQTLDGMPESIRSRVQSEMVQSNEQFRYMQLKEGWDDFFPSIPSVDDLLGGSSSGSSYDFGSTTSDLASSISGSSGSGSGINDASKGSAIGTGGSTVTNNNNTYNFVQNNYSPEALDRSEIYQQTRNQLNSFYKFNLETNLAK